jgi:hypothetical protein
VIRPYAPRDGVTTRKDMSEKSAAILTIKNAEKMTKKGRADIADWLRKQARFLTKHGDKYAKGFRARYLYR